MYLPYSTTLEFRRDAEACFSISQKIADRIAAHLQDNAYIRCVLQGHMDPSSVLSGMGYRTDSIDPIRSDLLSLHPGEFCSDMVFIFYRDTDTLLKAARQQCIGRLHLIQKKEANDLYEDLIRRGLNCHRETFSLEMGQPFRSLEDAAAFFLIHGEEDHIPSPEELLPRLIASEDPIFPYYYSSIQELEYLILSMDEIRKNY